MNLALDFGNTRIKAALFKGKELEAKYIYDSEQELLNALSTIKNIQHCIIGSVTNQHQKVFETLSKHYHTILFKAQTPIPLSNLYKSALTLGSDRIAASVGAYSLYPNQNVLTIDAGTCIKYNFVNSSNQYLGGAISPGIPMRLKAMNYYTQALPLVNADMNYDKLTGESTTESLLSGALLGAACEVDAMIGRYHEEYQNLVVLVTGGDADYLCKQVKSRFFTSQNLLLIGLNTILNYNLEK
ncbi:MAG: type III pantothenate kinase [Bacteroidia bacterium]|nr:type III pantothenate kinase [Bacteroidia bacterium]